MKKRSKSTWLTVYSVSKISLFSPILADGSSYTSISVVRFEVGCPFTRCLWIGTSDIMLYFFCCAIISACAFIPVILHQVLSLYLMCKTEGFFLSFFSQILVSERFLKNLVSFGRGGGGRTQYPPLIYYV